MKIVRSHECRYCDERFIYRYPMLFPIFHSNKHLLAMAGLEIDAANHFADHINAELAKSLY